MANAQLKPSVQSGWIERELAHKPRALFFTILAILWVFPSLGALWILLTDSNWLQAPTLLGRLRAIALEQWVAIFLLLAHGVWIYRAIRWRRREQPRNLGAPPADNPGDQNRPGVTD